MGAWVRSVAVGGVTTVLSVPAAQAANELKPRTPVTWAGPACMTVVDRSIEPVVHLDYTVLADDVEIGEDEVEDSRTHQFFAFRRQVFNLFAAEGFPNWITVSDVEDVATKEQAYPPPMDPPLDPDSVPAEDVLEHSQAWDGEWFRITADDERRPISEQAASVGIDWDTAAVPSGTYVVGGYTYEPRTNLWSGRWGAIRVTDGDPSIDGPAVFLSAQEDLVDAGATLEVEGCVDAVDGSTITVAFGTLEGVGQEPEWVTIVDAEPTQSGPLLLDFTPPECLGSTGTGKSLQVKLRIEIVDPSGSSYVAYSPRTIAVTPVTASECDADELEGSEGCGCRAHGSPRSLSALLWPIAAGLMVRRRRRPR